MRIHPNASQTSQLDVYRQRSERAGDAGGGSDARAKSAASESRSDHVTLSSEARLMSEAGRVARESSDIRQERVAALKAQVEAGTYQPDNRKIAEAMLREDMDLFRSLSSQ